MIGAESLIRFPVVDHRVIEACDVTARYPRLRMLDDRTIQTHDVNGVPVRTERRRFDHVPPPPVADVVLQEDAERPVVPEAADAAVNFARGVDESAAFAEGDDLFHHGHVSHGSAPTFLLCGDGNRTGKRATGRDDRASRSARGRASLPLAASRTNTCWFAKPQAAVRMSFVSCRMDESRRTR